MIASRFRAVGWVAGVAAAALSCYLVSLQVAAERAQLMTMERKILAARQDIRQLQTELDTRSRLVQLERWNADVLGLQAPQVSQYARGETQLAAYVAPRATPRVIEASLEVPARHEAPVVTPVSARRAPAPVPAPAPERAEPRAAPLPAPHAAPRVVLASASLPPRMAADAQPMLRRATYVPPSSSRLADLEPVVQKAALVARGGGSTPGSGAARLAKQSALLGDDLMGDIGRRAALEAKPKSR